MKKFLIIFIAVLSILSMNNFSTAYVIETIEKEEILLATTEITGDVEALKETIQSRTKNYEKNELQKEIQEKNNEISSLKNTIVYIITGFILVIILLICILYRIRKNNYNIEVKISKKTRLIIGIIVGLTLLIISLYVFINIYFITSISNGQLYDGFGMPYVNNEPNSRYTILGVLSLIGGLSLFRECLLKLRKL